MSLTTLSPSPDRAALALGRAERRLWDAEAEFDAAVEAGLPMTVLVVRDHEVRLAAVALAAARGATSFPLATFATC